VQGRKWIRNETCLSAASSFHFPFFDLHKREPEGQRLAVAFFCFLFLARQEKEVAAGLPPVSHHKVATASVSNKRELIPAESVGTTMEKSATITLLDFHYLAFSDLEISDFAIEITAANNGVC
jgi:hypothetical protein